MGFTQSVVLNFSRRVTRQRIRKHDVPRMFGPRKLGCHGAGYVLSRQVGAVHGNHYQFDFLGIDVKAASSDQIPRRTDV